MWWKCFTLCGEYPTTALFVIRRVLRYVECVVIVAVRGAHMQQWSSLHFPHKWQCLNYQLGLYTECGIAVSRNRESTIDDGKEGVAKLNGEPWVTEADRRVIVEVDPRRRYWDLYCAFVDVKKVYNYDHGMRAPSSHCRLNTFRIHRLRWELHWVLTPRVWHK